VPVDPIPRQAKNYQNGAGKVPFREWIAKLDGTVRARINVRIRKIAEFGSFGDCEPVGEGVYELRFDFGPGYRVYFGIDGPEIILLGGGNKDNQAADIKKAKARWSDYNA
jgi:putative addiction module killer protein